MTPLRMRLSSDQGFVARGGCGVAVLVVMSVAYFADLVTAASSGRPVGPNEHMLFWGTIAISAVATIIASSSRAPDKAPRAMDQRSTPDRAGGRPQGVGQGRATEVLIEVYTSAPGDPPGLHWIWYDAELPLERKLSDFVEFLREADLALGGNEAYRFVMHAFVESFVTKGFESNLNLVGGPGFTLRETDRQASPIARCRCRFFETGAPISEMECGGDDSHIQIFVMAFLHCIIEATDEAQLPHVTLTLRAML